MRIVTSVIVLVLKTLIKIGDGVLAVFYFVLKILKDTFLFLKKFRRFLLIRITRFKSFSSKVIKSSRLVLLKLRNWILNSILKPKPKFLRSRIELRQTKKRKRLIEVFPGPIPNLIKLKYFLIGSLFSLFFVFIPLLIIIFLQSLPNPKQLAFRDISQTTKIYDRNGQLLYQIYANQNRTLVPLSFIPKSLVDATIAIEDKDFYRNLGFNPTSIVRAAIANLKGEPLQGGSTITQQLIKATLLTPEITLERKIKEIILAFWAERIFSKDKILEMYFNQVPYGGTAWGVEAAAQTYFAKKVSDLNLSESSFLAGMPKAPTSYYPFGEFPNLWKVRQRQVLNRMEELGFIGKEQKRQTIEQELSFLPPQTPIYAPHFVFYVRDLLIKKYGLPMVEKGGLIVVTSLDLSIQEQVQNIVKEEVERSFFFNLTNGAALVTNPKNGDVLAMIGSRDFYDPEGGAVNVTTSLRQPGSSIKVVTYSSALQNGFTAATVIPDTPITFRSSPLYSPVNYDGKFHGNVTLRLALGNSINVPAVKTLAKIGISTMVDQAKKMGITNWDEPNSYGLAITLGAAEVKMTDLATVYGTLANSGRRVDLNPILKVSDSQGNIIFQKKEQNGSLVVNPGVAFIISNILSDNSARTMEFGPNSPLNIPGYEVSVKTGTSDKIRDNWTIGYTPSLVVATWVGNNNGQPMSGIASGITGAAPIWHTITKSLLKDKPKEKFQIPENIVVKNCLGRKEFFIKGTENSVRCVLPSPSPTPSPQ